jgi:hypothetical protein
MSNANTSFPLIQTITPERWAGLSLDFIEAGYVGLLVKNGQLVRKLVPGRHFSFAVPWLEKAQILLVDTKLRNLEVISKGDFLSRDQFLVNISLSVLYQVIDPKRVALELSDPVAALTSAVKDTLGVVVNQMQLSELVQQGRVEIRQHLISHLDFYSLGFNLEDVRVGDISCPQVRGVVRQIEGMTARAEAEHDATLRAQLSQTEQTQTGRLPQPRSNQSGPNPATVAIEGTPPVQLPPPHRSSGHLPVAPTTLADAAPRTACLVHRATGTVIPLLMNPFTIGREPHNSLVPEDTLCSRNHARIERTIEAGITQYQLIDIGSSNGTYLDQQRIAPHQPMLLQPNSLIRIGNEEWRFDLGDEGSNP